MMDQSIYIQICVRVPEEGATGSVVAQAVKRVVSAIRAPWVATSDVDVSGNVRSDLLVASHERKIMKTAQLLELIECAEQVVWASLFFCRDKAAALSIRPDESYADSTLKAEAVVRVVDATYIYIIASKAVAEQWAKQFSAPDVKEGAIDQMDFPE